MAVKTTAGTLGDAAGVARASTRTHVFDPMEEPPRHLTFVEGGAAWRLGHAIADLSRGARTILQIVDRDEVMAEAVGSGVDVADASELPLFSITDRHALLRMASAAMLCVAEKAEHLIHLSETGVPGGAP